jgi:fructose-1,6-bisphosphatase
MKEEGYTKRNEAFLRVNPFLRDKGVPDTLRDIIFSIAHAGKYVAHSLRHDHMKYAYSENASGEQQLALDVRADKIFCEHLRSTKQVARFASEEQENEVILSPQGAEQYCVSFDPLDGSSLVDANFTIGSIFGIFRGDHFMGKTGRDIEAAGYILYGPRTILVIATEEGVWEFSENGIGEFIFSRGDFSLQPEAYFFAPGNLRAVSEREEYKKLVHYWAERGLTLRYSGGMVPDVHMMVTKGSGIFCYPGHSKYPKGKLRLLYECAPLSFIVEKIGGLACDEYGKNILDQKVTELHQRTSIIFGSKEEVAVAIQKLREC